jgi:hypothetical protein
MGIRDSGAFTLPWMAVSRGRSRPERAEISKSREPDIPDAFLDRVAEIRAQVPGNAKRIIRLGRQSPLFQV